MKYGVISIALAVVVVAAVPAYALESANGITVADSATRIANNKKENQAKLSAAETKRLQERCVAAQTKLEQARTTLESNNQPALTRYAALVTKLNQVQQSRASAAQSNGDLTAASASLTQKVNSYQSAYDAIKQDLVDIKTIDCKADPSGFIATLKQVRKNYEAMVTARGEAAIVVKDTLQPAIQKIKDNQ